MSTTLSQSQEGIDWALDVLHAAIHSDSNEGDLEGATNMLTLSMRYVFEDWKLLLEFCISMLHSTHIEKHSIQENVNSLLTFLFYLPDLPLSYILGGKDMAGAALSEFSSE